MIRKKIGILGSGTVGRTLGTGFITSGYEVMIGTRSPENIRDWQNSNPESKIGSFDEAASFGDIVVLALKGAFASDVLANLAPGILEGKTILDATNPISDNPPVNGVLDFFTGSNESLMERLQGVAPSANFVKCFNSVSSVVMFRPQFEGKRPTMFICGDNGAAKIEARNILDQFGWKVEDLGAKEAARPIESLARLICIRGIVTGNWKMALEFLAR